MGEKEWVQDFSESEVAKVRSTQDYVDAVNAVLEIAPSSLALVLAGQPLE